MAIGIYLIMELLLSFYVHFRSMVNLTQLGYFIYWFLARNNLPFIFRILGFNTTEYKLNLIVVYKFHVLLLLLFSSIRNNKKWK